MELDFKLIISKGSNFFFLTDGTVDITVKDEWVDSCVGGSKMILIFLMETFMLKKIGLAVFVKTQLTFKVQL